MVNAVLRKRRKSDYMDLKKIVISGIVYYAIIFLTYDLFMFGPLVLEGMALMAVGMVASIITAYMLARDYYFKKKPKNYLKEGIIYGLGIVVISTLIEVPVMVYGHAKDVGWAWYTQLPGLRQRQLGTL